MTGEIDGIGDVITGALAAKAVDGASDSGHASGSGRCLNCGANLIGSHCHQCGQAAHIHRSLGAFFHDLLHGVLHFDGKIWRTLPLLAWRPGELTRRYAHGERARFVSPLALFLFGVFILFGIASFTGSDLGGVRAPLEQSIVQEVKEQNARIQTLEQALAAGDLDAETISGMESDLEFAQRRRERAMEAYRSVADETDRQATPESFGTVENDIADVVRDMNGVADDEAEVTPPDGENYSTVTEETVKEVDQNWFLRKLASGVEKAQANPALIAYKIKTNAYKFGWLLIPISVPFVWLALVGRRMREWHLYDHVIFTTYSIAFMMLLLIVLIVAGMIGVPTVFIALTAVFYPPFHMYRQLKGAYRLSRVSALARTSLLLVFSVLALFFFVSGLVAVGLVG